MFSFSHAWSSLLLCGKNPSHLMSQWGEVSVHLCRVNQEEEARAAMLFISFFLLGYYREQGMAD